MLPLGFCCDFSRKTGTAQVNLNRVHAIPQEMVICAKYWVYSLCFRKVSPGRLKQTRHRAAALSAAWAVCGYSVDLVCCSVLEGCFD